MLDWKELLYQNYAQGSSLLHSLGLFTMKHLNYISKHLSRPLIVHHFQDDMLGSGQG